MTGLTRRSTMIGLSAVIGMPAYAQDGGADSRTAGLGEVAILEKPAMFEMVSISGNLKETRQAGQELTWRRVKGPADKAFLLGNLAVGLLAVRGRVTLTFSCSVSSLGYMTPQEAQVHVILRTKGGTPLYTSVIGLWVQCRDEQRVLHPTTDELPTDIAGVVFANVAVVEITEHTEPNARGLTVQRCR